MSKPRHSRAGRGSTLYNFTVSPGWTEEEIQIMKLALTKFGIGNWIDIVNSGVLPGKTPSQLNLQTQRLLGQQSLAEFKALHIDVDKVREVNAEKQGPEYQRKNGFLVNTGNKLTKQESQKRRSENEKRFGVPEEEWRSIRFPKKPKSKVRAPREASQHDEQATWGSEMETDSEPPCTSDSDTDSEYESTQLTSLRDSGLELSEIEANIPKLVKRLKEEIEHRRGIQASYVKCLESTKVEGVAVLQRMRAVSGEAKSRSAGGSNGKKEKE